MDYAGSSKLLQEGIPVHPLAPQQAQLQAQLPEALQAGRTAGNKVEAGRADHHLVQAQDQALGRQVDLLEPDQAQAQPQDLAGRVQPVALPQGHRALAHHLEVGRVAHGKEEHLLEVVPDHLQVRLLDHLLDLHQDGKAQTEVHPQDLVLGVGQAQAGKVVIGRMVSGIVVLHLAQDQAAAQDPARVHPQGHPQVHLRAPVLAQVATGNQALQAKPLKGAQE